MCQSRHRNRFNVVRKTFRAEALARLQRGIIADCGFAERLVVFSSDHFFCISANKGGPARMWAGSFEREAIRPYVLGRFGDMLPRAASGDAVLSGQPAIARAGFRAGKSRSRGLNENLAREILELHTVGVGGGYTQDDVTARKHHHRVDYAAGSGNWVRPDRSCSTPMRMSPARSA